MKFFNLMEYRLLKESMANPYGGSTHYKNREPLRWWNYEDLRASPKVSGRIPISADEDEDDAETTDPIDQWVIWARRDNSLNKLLRDAGIYRTRKLWQIHEEYGMPVEEASKMMKTFVGYHPSYGGYICQIGPYVSSGGGHGEEHVRQEGKTKFSSFVLPRKRTTLADVQNALAQNINDYIRTFGIQFTPEDFGLDVMRPASETLDVTRAQPQDNVIEEHIDNLSPDNPALQDFGRRAPMIGIGSRIDFNSRGWEKILTSLMGPWYRQTLEERARLENKTVRQLAAEMLTDTNILKRVYDQARKKWEQARDSGEAAAIGMPEPPVFANRKRGVFGAQGFSALKPSNKLLSNQQRLKIQIIDMMKEGITDPQQMADRLNADPKRKAENYRLKYRGEEPIVISTDEVNRHIDMINHEMQEQNIDINQVYDNALTFQDKMLSTAGYDDLKTALEVASIHWSAGTEDPVTRTKMGTSNAIAFIPPEDFSNYTSDELREMKEAKEDLEAIQRGETPPVRAPRAATPEQLQRDIGSRMPDAERTEPETTTAPVPAQDLGDFGDDEDFEEIPPVAPEKSKSKPKGKQVKEKAKEKAKVKPKEKVKEKAKTPQPEPVPAFEEDDDDIYSSTIQTLIKVAEELDLENKFEEAEEVHKVIRKYVEKL